MPPSPKRLKTEEQKLRNKLNDLIKSDAYKAAEAYGRRIALALAGGRYDLAKRVLNIAVYEIEAEPDTIPERPLRDVGINDRTANMLEREFGAYLVGDLAAVTTEDLLRVDGVNLKTVDHIWQSLLTAVLKGSEGKSDGSEG